MHDHPATQPLLVELLTEELPPKALQKLGTAFAKGLHEVLEQHNLLDAACTATEFATPRRLAVLFSAVRGQAPDHDYAERLMPVRIGLTDTGEFTPALTKRLASRGLEHLAPDDLITESDGKQDFLVYKGVAAGTHLAEGLQQALEHAIHHLPIPKVMHYQLPSGESLRFVRPVHRLLALWGDQIVPVQVLGLEAGRTTAGHRFLGDDPITLPDANQYDSVLRDQGKVIASFTERRALIAAELQNQADTLGAVLGDDAEVAALLDEVTALVEQPSVYVGKFDPQFLRIPAECLILTMRLNQKYFPLFESDTGSLTNQFLIVSNMAVANPANIIEGNERVVRPRLADAQFFFDTDLKVPLDSRVESLKTIVYHNKLGSQFDRMQRVHATAGYLASQLGADREQSQRAACLAKADLASSMVGEFPELQGLIGARYAAHDGESAEVALALATQYKTRLSEPVQPHSLVAAILFIAERVETLVGIWGIGLHPTGERDPFGLRRAALGVISAYEQLTSGGYLDVSNASQLDLAQLLDFAAHQFPEGTLDPDTVDGVRHYVVERYRNQLGQHADRQVVDAVLAIDPPMHQVQARVQACVEFARRPQASSLAAANKRVANILRRAPEYGDQMDTSLLREPAEQTLANTIATLGPQARELQNKGDFSGSMAILAESRDAVDGFFDHVMIMADDPAIRANRLALLHALHQLMNQVADISRLAS